MILLCSLLVVVIVVVVIVALIKSKRIVSQHNRYMDIMKGDGGKQSSSCIIPESEPVSGRISGCMPVGISVGDTILTSFSVRRLTAGDEMDALDMLIEAGTTSSGGVTLARLAAVTEIEGFGRPTYQLLRSMHPCDVEAIQKAYSEVEANFPVNPVLVL